MPDWIADKIVKYDYFSSDYVRKDKNVQFENVNSVPTAKNLSQESIKYINECVDGGLPIEMPNHHGEE